jgi:hypothetical protein
MEQGEAWSSSM